MASFGREQARWFFGRDELTSELIARLDERLRTGGVQVVVAPSGAGKSSLLHAGLLPQLEDGALPGSSRWPRMVFTPTAQPLGALATQVAALTGADPATLTEDLAAGLQRYVEVLRGHLGSEDLGSRVVVVVDQLEELFTLCTDDQHRRTFIESLALLARPPQPVGLVVVGVRADFYAACVNYPELRTALQDNPLVVGPMSDTELRAAIRYPARDVGLDVESGLVELLLQDLGDTAGGMTGYESGRLPLLAHALRTTWQQRHGHTLTVDGYRTTGGIHRAVATTAEGVFTGLDPAGQHEARILFLRLIKIGDGTEDTRRRVARADLLRGRDPSGVSPVVDAFTQGRLLTQDRDTVEITHEALLRAWPRLRQWVDGDRAGNLIRQELEEATAVWDRDRRDTAGLYRGSRLEAARTWADSTSHEGDLSAAATAFLAASTAAEDREHTAARRRTRRLRRLVALLTVLFLLAAVTTVVAVQAQTTATQQRNIAVARQVVGDVGTLRVTNPALAAQISLAAYRLAPTIESSGSVLSVFASPYATKLTGHSNSVNAVALSPGGRTLATASDDHTVRLWDVTDPHHPKDLAVLPGHTMAVESVAFSPDGRTLATVSDDRTARLWDVTASDHPRALATLTGFTDTALGVVFSRDGRVLATTGSDGTRLWDIVDPRDPKQVAVMPDQGGAAVVFSPDGRTLAAAGGAIELLGETDVQRVATQICDIAYPRLTPADWDHYFPNLPYDPPCP